MEHVEKAFINNNGTFVCNRVNVSNGVHSLIKCGPYGSDYLV